MLQLQAVCFRDSGPRVEACFANQKLGSFEAGKYGGGLIIVENTIFADRPLPADLHPLHWVRVRTRDNSPFLCACDDAAHDVPQVDYHVPGRAFVLEPVEDSFAVLEVREPYPGTECFRWGVHGANDARAKVRKLGRPASIVSS